MLQAAGTLPKGILAALLVAVLAGWFSTTRIATAEMAGRGNATFLDMGVALASGFIGAYAKARDCVEIRLLWHNMASKKVNIPVMEAAWVLCKVSIAIRW